MGFHGWALWTHGPLGPMDPWDPWTLWEPMGRLDLLALGDTPWRFFAFTIYLFLLVLPVTFAFTLPTILENFSPIMSSMGAFSKKQIVSLGRFQSYKLSKYT